MNTPLTRVDRLATAIGLKRGQLWVKRDDLTGLTAGGNKARKLEYLVAEALEQRADVLVTTGAAQSNHVRATAAAARTVGLDCVAVLSTLGAQHEPEGNLVLDDLFDVSVVWTGPAEREQTLAETAAALAGAGRSPYAIPLGGTNALGARGYVHAAEEVAAVLPDAVVACAVGTGGTAAGLIVGLGDHDRVLGIDVAAVPGLDERIPDVIAGCAAAMELPAPRGDWHPDTRYSHIPYGQPFDAVADAIRITAKTTGLVLDPVYTGRAMAGLIERARAGELPDAPIVFLHSGGLPALFTARYRDWFSLPAAL
ncbi:MAG: pyridoxal-phosphate dependent enzyme [Actinobacteria bacterium]|nr:pyridoxal-phosphate dependent enzyme [Actinomycetota bacterium]